MILTRMYISFLEETSSQGIFAGWLSKDRNSFILFLTHNRYNRGQINQNYKGKKSCQALTEGQLKPTI